MDTNYAGNEGCSSFGRPRQIVCAYTKFNMDVHVGVNNAGWLAKHQSLFVKNYTKTDRKSNIVAIAGDSLP